MNNLINSLFQVMRMKGINIPQNIANDPNQIVNYLLQNGYITQDQFNNAYSQARNMRPNQNR